MFSFPYFFVAGFSNSEAGIVTFASIESKIMYERSEDSLEPLAIEKGKYGKNDAKPEHTQRVTQHGHN